MRPLDIAIREITKKEVEHHLYDYKVDGLSLYSVIRLDVRKSVLRQWGLQSMEVCDSIKWMKVIKSCFHSFIDLLFFYYGKTKCSTLFMAFPRVDKVNGLYLDKFTDPLIDCSGLKQGYVIFEPGRGGEHKKPRYHERSIVNIDALSAFVALYGVIKSVFKTKKIELEFVELMKSINMAFDDINVNSSLLRKKIYADIFSVHLYERIYRKKGVEAVFATVRPLDVFCAGNNLGLKTYELQHGVSYEGTELYSGFRDERLLPSYFLAFGENEPKDVYGISEDRIINIGFAFHTFLNNLIPKTELNISNAVLVVSDPEITNTLVPLVAGLAKDNKDMTMYYRCHPHEFLASEQKQVLLDSGVKIQDNTINISIVLNQFNNIIGENSTVLYEAISCGKKVGKLFFEGLNPEYLSPSDKDCFWEIRSQEDFENFIKAPVSQKKNKSIYSDFNVGLFKNLLKR